MTAKLAAVVILVGSILFLVAAFHPVSRIFGITDSSRKLEIIMSERSGWTFTQWLFAVGAIVTTVGVALAGIVIRGNNSSLLTLVGAGLMLVGALLWSYHTYLRCTDPEAFVNGQQPGWTFVVYTLLSLAGLALFGVALLQSPLSDWVGWTAIASTGLFLILFMVFGDLPPFSMYLVTGLIAVMLLVRGSAFG